LTKEFFPIIKSKQEEEGHQKGEIEIISDMKKEVNFNSFSKTQDKFKKKFENLEINGNILNIFLDAFEKYSEKELKKFVSFDAIAKYLIEEKFRELFDPISINTIAQILIKLNCPTEDFGGEIEQLKGTIFSTNKNGSISFGNSRSNIFFQLLISILEKKKIAHFYRHPYLFNDSHATSYEYFPLELIVHQKSCLQSKLFDKSNSIPIPEKWIKFLGLHKGARMSKKEFSLFEINKWLRSKNGYINKDYLEHRKKYSNSIFTFSSNNPAFDSIITMEILDEDSGKFIQKNWILQAKLRKSTSAEVMETFKLQMQKLIQCFPQIGLKRSNTEIIVYSPNNVSKIGKRIDKIKLNYRIGHFSDLVNFLGLFKKTN